MWTWDGRDLHGRRAPQGFYRVEVRTPRGHVKSWTEVDLTFQAGVWLKETFGRPAREVQPVYPRTRVVRDSVGILATSASANERFRRELLRVRDHRGRVVMRRDLLEHPTMWVDDGRLKYAPAVWDARDATGRALPPGRYTAVVTGEDVLGNSGSTKLPLWVSAVRLVWVERGGTQQPVRWGHEPPVGCLLGRSVADHPAGPERLLRARARSGSGSRLRPGGVRRSPDQLRGVRPGDRPLRPSDPVVLDRGAGPLGLDLDRRRSGAWSGPASCGRLRCGPLGTTGTDSSDVASFTLDLCYLAVSP